MISICSDLLGRRFSKTARNLDYEFCVCGSSGAGNAN
jgi:hypothetical protein